MKRFFSLFLIFFTASLFADSDYEVKELTDRDADNQIAKGIVIVDVYANWCAPCRKMAPIFKEFAQEMEEHERASAFKADIDQMPEFCKANKVRSIPTFLLFYEGEEVDRLVGSCSKKELEEMVYGAEEYQDD